ncbi:UPF0104 family protein, partial [Mycobacterium tuberculosis]|nr:UPF0104 family protein [Mycobacterium tuberculosis]
AVLVPGLVSSGMPLPSAISAMLIYRLISWLLIAAIGWVVFFFMFRTESTADSDNDRDPPTDPNLRLVIQPQGTPCDDPVETTPQGPAPTPDLRPEGGETPPR